MKKLSTFLKTLLVAVGIGVGSNAWGDDYMTLYSQDYESAETADWKASNGAAINLVTGDATYGKYVTIGTGSGSGNRSAYLYPSSIPTDFTTYGAYTIEFDAKTPPAKLINNNNQGNTAISVIGNSTTTNANQTTITNPIFLIKTVYSYTDGSSSEKLKRFYINNSETEYVDLDYVWYHFL